MHLKRVDRVTRLKGTVSIPGDKSISHRSVMLAGLSSNRVHITNFLQADDCMSTVACIKSLGVKVEHIAANELYITGNGLFGLKEPENILDAGNSGTTMRLLAGILGAQPFFSVLTGDDSLRHRPMDRVVAPLSKMGCMISGRRGSRYAPLAITPPDKIKGIDYKTPVASAQIKSALLLAGLFADSPTIITEPRKSRDHSERILTAFGAGVTVLDTTITLEPPKELNAPDHLEIPGDISSAAFWLVAASIIPDSEIMLVNVGINPTRTGIIEILIRMGADIEITNKRLAGKEPIADLFVRSSQLVGVEIEPDIIPSLVDEIPVLAVAALFAEGRTIIRGAGELRVKETDRLKAISMEFNRMGAGIIETEDGLIIDGKKSLCFARCDSHHDHRMAMALAVAGTAGQGVEIAAPDCVSISYPDFYSAIDKLSL